MTLLASLLSGEIPVLCQEPDGQWRTDAPRDAGLLCGSFHPLHAGHVRLADVAARRLRAPVAFEMTVRNADKAALSAIETERRLRQFHWLRRIWLTTAATFAEKARLFPGVVWIVGADTAERILQPRFYGGQTARRDDALHELRGHGCRFLVAGRVDATGAFAGTESLGIPHEFRDLFESIPEHEFRWDVSSTLLRNVGKGL